MTKHLIFNIFRSNKSDMISELTLHSATVEADMQRQMIKLSNGLFIDPSKFTKSKEVLDELSSISEHIHSLNYKASNIKDFQKWIQGDDSVRKDLCLSI